VTTGKNQRYRVLKKLGSGGMGDVCLAEDVILERKVALKFLSKSTGSDPAARRRFLREAKAAAAIDHPYVCKVYEAGEQNGELFIAMEYIEGEDLYALLRRGRLPFEDALRIGTEIIEGLARAHEDKVVHRDLKPSNIMLTRDGHVKIVDFGLARRLASDDTRTLSGPSLTQTGVMVGTIVYMSPEQLRGEPADERSDIFSLGLILYEMLAGRHPLLRKTYVATATAILREDPPPLSEFLEGCPEGVEHLVMRMLAREPGDRFSSATEVVRELREYRSGVRVSIAPRSGTSAPGIAVLPFVNRSRDEEFDYFVEGMTDEINARISKIAGLKVISRSSAMRYKDSPKTLQEIGQELGVGFLVEGSVQHFGSRVRVIAGVVEVETSSQVWAETYDHDLKDIFQIQTEVSRHIAVAVRGRFSGVTGSASTIPEQPQNMAAYEFHLRGVYFMNKWTPGAVRQAIEYFGKAIVADPKYAPSQAGLATCYGRASLVGFLPAPEIASEGAKARAAAQRALELKPNLPEAHVGKAVVALGFDWDWRTAEAALDRALDLNPNLADAHMLLGWLLSSQGRFDEARPHAERAVELSPLDPGYLTQLGWEILHSEGPTETAEQKLRQALEIEPNFLMAKMNLAKLYFDREEMEKGLAIFEAGGPWSKPQLAAAYATAGRTETARRILQEITAPGEVDRHSPFDLARLYLLLSDEEKGFGWLEKACQAHDSHMFYINVMFRSSPILRKYSSDPRYLAILRRIGLS
jgi:serine/threonine protein kinase/tetratricopeptide (TPR) repeat protein